MYTNKIPITWIEQYNYCPKQLENEINNKDKEEVKEIEEGLLTHRQRANRFYWQEDLNEILKKRKIRKQKIPLLHKREYLISLIKDGKNGIFREVFVESEDFEICGSIDEVKIENGIIYIFEDKTSFKYVDLLREWDCYIKQIVSYALAFKEYFECQNSEINMQINRIEVKRPLKTFPELKECITYKEKLSNVNDIVESIKKDIYEIKRIRDNKLDSPYPKNSAKCRKCAFKKSCEDSLYYQS